MAKTGSGHNDKGHSKGKKDQGKAQGKKAAAEPEVDLETLADLFHEHADELLEEKLLDLGQLVTLFNSLADEVLGEDFEGDEYDDEYEEDDDTDFEPEFADATGISFKDVGGIREIKDDLGDIVKFLRNPKRYTRKGIGAKLPKGYLLSGPPGTGKTLLARAIASEVGAPILSISGGEFESKWVGVGKDRVRKLIKFANDSIEQQKAAGKKCPACIIFIDEIDVLGAKRTGEDTAGNHSIMMELIQAMDGFKPSDGLIFIAATNRPDVLDPALTRPGRFDRQLEVPAPDMKGREEILKAIVNSRKISLKTNVDLKALAQKTSGFVGADLNLLINEAAILTGHKPNARKIGREEINKAYDRVLKGPRSYLKMSKWEKESTALHEAAHAIAGLRKEADGMDMLRSVTILPHTGSLGTTYFGNDRDVYAHTQKKFKAELVVDYAGRAAEELAYGAENVSSGASGDIQNATHTVSKMVTQFGFNKELGLLQYGEDKSGYLGQSPINLGELDPQTARLAIKEMTALASEAYEEAKQILTQDYDALIRLAQALMEHETLERDEVIAITGIEPGKPKQESLRKLAGYATPPGLVHKPG